MIQLVICGLTVHSNNICYVVIIDFDAETEKDFEGRINFGRCE